MDSARRKRIAFATGQTACNPCRHRKVRCSYQSPCQACIDHEYPELCIYRPPIRRVLFERHSNSHQSAPPASPSRTLGAWPPSKEEWHSLVSRVDQLETSLALRGDPAVSLVNAPSPLPRDDESSSTEPYSAIHAKNPMTGESVFLGANSVPAMAAALANSDESRDIQSLISRKMLPIFALENETLTYPFIDIWDSSCGTSERAQRLCTLIPTDAEALSFLRQYKDNAHVLFPAIIRLEQFEAQVTSFFTTRAKQQDALSPDGMRLYGQSLHWLGLFFACMASGCQCSNMERKQRQLTSQVFVCCAYECLRLINYLSNSNLEDIQNLLVLGNVISNNMNAGVAWTLLGLTTRIAQGLGLHYNSVSMSSQYDADLRYQIWSRIIWQDSLLSITYDRASSINSISQWGSAGPTRNEELSYTESMLTLCRIALDIVNSRASVASNQQLLSQIDTRRQEILSIGNRMQPHLQKTTACVSVVQILEHWNWRMHRSYVLSELLRPSLAKHQGGIHGKDQYAALCLEALTETLDAFLNLQNLTAFARTSWAAVHRALSSALLLAIMKVPGRNTIVLQMINSLITVMGNMEATHMSEVSAPVARAVEALTLLTSSSKTQDASTSSTAESSPYAEMQNILWGGISKSQ
ncbi:hypothetical protein VHEMI05876 [[Torrubiella] hemipterigena]|uniref:Zn(2)-C6 fungal-type domain-containing protein n=1 Tax=[Torrubiella] hemipterigena TaxID=1531966 RepID=A0A0A1TI22_9HYPO|nr:hypothetical protein VHEMI05876 [[Torrubiella] hemipterigena]